MGKQRQMLLSQPHTSKIVWQAMLEGHLLAELLKLKIFQTWNIYQQIARIQEENYALKAQSYSKGISKTLKNNKEVFDEDGWLHTGDVVEIWDNGAIKLIDRKKNLFKLSQGEYISPEKLENVYNKSLFVAQIFVDGSSTESYIVAIIVPDPDYCKHWASKAGLDKEGKDLFNSPELIEAIQKDFEEKAINANLNSLEKIKKFQIIGEMFSVDNGLLTPSMKLVRHTAKKRFRDLVIKMYNDS